MRAIAVITLALALAGSAASQTTAKVRGPWLLISLTSLGTVNWRCLPEAKHSAAPGLPGLALGFRAVGATTRVQLRVRGKRASTRVVDPGELVVFPFLPARVQVLDLVQRSGAGALRATVRVDFAPGGANTYCYSYLPPRVHATFGPRG